MKATPLVLVAIMVLTPPARAQEQEGSTTPATEAIPAQPDSPTSGEPAITDTQNEAAPPLAVQQDKAARTFIPGSLQVPPFTPPVPPPRKVVQPIRIDASVTVPTKNSRTLTIQRGEPSTKPDLPPPPPPPPPPFVQPTPLMPEQIARQIWERRHNLNLGATIYDHKVSVVNWTDQETLVHYEAVCGFDIGLLAGLGGFVHKGENYSLFLMHGHFSTTAVRRFASQWHPNIPEVAPGQIIITRGDPTDQVATAPMHVIKDIIAAEEPRLLPYQVARETYYAASAAWHAAHPPIPRDQTFILRPHRGSRYLPATQPTKP
ncbi:MAG: hypothetical protein WCP35_19135 [Verrucomicrobiota bacterium]